MRQKVNSLIRTVGELSEIGRFEVFKDPDRRLIRLPSVVKTFQSNPYLYSNSQPAQIVGVVEETIIGGVGTMPMNMVADGKVYETSANPDLLVNKNFRNTGYALELLESEPQTSRDSVAVNFYVSIAARRVAAFMGIVVFGIAQFSIVRRSEHFFSHRLPRWLKSIACAFMDVVFTVHRFVVAVIVKIKTRGWKLECVSDDASIAEFASLVSTDRHRFREDVSFKFLKWVLENDFDPVELADKRLWRVSIKDKVIGFVMTRVSNMGTRARVVEWQAVPGKENNIPWMILCAAFKALGGRSAVVISVDANDAGLVSTLRRLLPKLPDQAATVNVSEGSPLESHEGWKDQSNWRIRPIMGDCAFY